MFTIFLDYLALRCNSNVHLIVVRVRVRQLNAYRYFFLSYFRKKIL